MVEREFAPTPNKKNLDENYIRVFSDTKESTKKAYKKRFVQWFAFQENAGEKSLPFEDIDKKILQLSDGWIEGLYKHSTIRQYRASLIFGICCARKMQVDGGKSTNKEPNDKKPDLFESLVASLSESGSVIELNRAYRDALELGEHGNRKEIEKKAEKNQATSSIKDKRFDSKLLFHVLNYKPSKERYQLLRQFLVVNSKLGLRPIEYGSVFLIDRNTFNRSSQLRKYFELDSSTSLNIKKGLDYKSLGINTDSTRKDSPILAIKNAKNSHGRTFGEYRFLHLDILSDKELNFLFVMLKTMRENRKTDFDKDVIRPMQAQLRRILTTDKNCIKRINSLNKKSARIYRATVAKNRKNGKVDSDVKFPVFKRPSIYSTRHQAVANAKEAGVSPVEIAAAFGHSSVQTASLHYGKRFFGSGSGAVKPTQESVNRVINLMSEPQIKKVKNLIETKKLELRKDTLSTHAPHKIKNTKGWSR